MGTTELGMSLAGWAAGTWVDFNQQSGAIPASKPEGKSSWARALSGPLWPLWAEAAMWTKAVEGSDPPLLEV